MRWQVGECTIQNYFIQYMRNMMKPSIFPLILLFCQIFNSSRHTSVVMD